MKFQRFSWSCGLAAVSNAIRMLGKNRSEKTIARYTNTTRQEGTNEDDMIASIEALGFDVSVHESSSWKETYNWLKKNIELGNSVILATDQYQHWVTAIGLFGRENIVIFDPAGMHKKVKQDNGVFVYTKRALKRRWLHRREKQFYGLAVSKR